MRRSTFLLALPAVTITLFLSGSAAHAQSLTTFASVDTIGQVFTFINAGASSTLGLTSASIPVTFRYKVANGYGGINIDIPATMTLSATVTGGAGGYLQQMNNINLNITANTAINGKTNLLTMGATGRLNASEEGSDIANFGGNTRNSFVVGFTSDFLNFGNTTDRSFNFAFNSLTPQASLNGNGYLNTFDSSGLGNFASNPAPQTTVPEPSALALLGIAGMPVLALRRRTSR